MGIIGNNISTRSPLRHKDATDPQHNITYGEGHDNSAHPDIIVEKEKYPWEIPHKERGKFLGNFKSSKEENGETKITERDWSEIEKKFKVIDDYTIDYEKDDILMIGFNSPGNHLQNKHSKLKLEYAFQDWINRIEGKDVTGGWKEILLLMLGGFVGSFAKVIDFWFNNAEDDVKLLEHADD